MKQKQAARLPLLMLEALLLTGCVLREDQSAEPVTACEDTGKVPEDEDKKMISALQDLLLWGRSFTKSGIPAMLAAEQKRR